ncbi:MAG TPA: AAA family ATPase, partial [Pseudonocardiaceae bacterium]|nr:AAA family ATPase [Pseudonocardiaceae bacterium]
MRPGSSGEPHLIDRHDLVAALDDAVARGVTIISAPAGSGKTSLLRSWANAARNVVFVTVQRDQRDAQMFWLTLLAALRRDVAAPAATPGFNGPAMVDRVLSELNDDHGGRLTLLIDDLHELTSQEAVDQLADLLARLPPHVHAVLATRRDPRLRLHQLRLTGELAEIRAAELRFTEAETRTLLVDSDITLSDTAITMLHRRTEGWAAGLRLAAISLAAHPDPERFVAEFSGSNRTVAEYLLAEMLERQPDHVRNLLLRTSLPDHVNGELADLLAGRPGSEQVLLDLEDANAFVVSIDP